MARNKNDDNTQNEAAQESVQTNAAPAAAAAPVDERIRYVTNPDDGSVMKRADFIRLRWSQKKSRGDIAKELSKITGKKVPYQVVFAVIKKGTPGGPDRPVEAPVAAEAAAN